MPSSHVRYSNDLLELFTLQWLGGVVTWHDWQAMEGPERARFVEAYLTQQQIRAVLDWEAHGKAAGGTGRR